MTTYNIYKSGSNFSAYLPTSKYPQGAYVGQVEATSVTEAEKIAAKNYKTEYKADSVRLEKIGGATVRGHQRTIALALLNAKSGDAIRTSQFNGKSAVVLHHDWLVGVAKVFGISVEIGNDAPKGGKMGFFVTVK